MTFAKKRLAHIMVLFISATAAVWTVSQAFVGSAQTPTCKAKIAVIPIDRDKIELTQAAQHFDTGGFNTIPIMDSRPMTVRVYLEQDPPNCSPGLKVDGWLSSEGTTPSFLARGDKSAVVPGSGSDRKTEASTLNFTVTPNFFSEGSEGGGLGSFRVCVSHFEDPASPIPPPSASSDIGDSGHMWDDCSDVITYVVNKPCGADIVAVPLDNVTDGRPEGPPLEHVGPPSGASMLYATHPVPILSERMRYRWSSENPPSHPLAVDDILLPTVGLAEGGRYACRHLQPKLLLETPPANLIYGWYRDGVTSYPGVICQAVDFTDPSFEDDIIFSGNAAIGTDLDVKYQRVFAHELMHTLGKQGHERDNLDEPGWDVLHKFSSPDARLKWKLPHHIFPLMRLGKNTDEAWIMAKNYQSMTQGDSSIRSYDQRFGCSDLPPLARVSLPIIVPLESGGHDIAPVFTLDNYVEPYRESTNGNTTLRLVDDNDVVQYTHSYTSTAQESPYLAVVPAYTDTVRMEVLSGGTLSHVKTRSGSSPAISITAPISGSVLTNLSDIAWTATDADGDDMLFTVQYSHDQGSRWLPVASMITETHATLITDFLPSSASATIRVLATDGMRTTVATVENLQLLPNRLPTVEIVFPHDSQSIRQGANLSLIALVQDLEDEFVSQSAITWTSNIDGVIGYGSIINSALLSIGTHTITASAIDSAAGAGSASVILLVY